MVVFTDFPACAFVILRLYLQTPPSLRATSPNLGEELSYIAGVNAIRLTINTLIYH